MKEYIKAYALFIVLVIASLFGTGFVVGIFMGITGNANINPDTLQSQAWFNILIFMSLLVCGFLSFKFTVDKFLIDK
jgi:hypothetical protein